jgi:hypothetical protein
MKSSMMATDCKCARDGDEWTGRYPAIAVTAARLPVRSFTFDAGAVVCEPDGAACATIFRHPRKLGLDGIVSKAERALSVGPFAGLPQGQEPGQPGFRPGARGSVVIGSLSMAEI